MPLQSQAGGLKTNPCWTRFDPVSPPFDVVWSRPWPNPAWRSWPWLRAVGQVDPRIGLPTAKLPRAVGGMPGRLGSGVSGKVAWVRGDQESAVAGRKRRGACQVHRWPARRIVLRDDAGARIASLAGARRRPEDERADRSTDREPKARRITARLAELRRIGRPAAAGDRGGQGWI